MAKLKVLGSGSSGNAYILECNEETLILELGIKWKDILLGLDFDISKVVGCLVTHQHNDHQLSVPNAIKSRLDVYSCESVHSKHEAVKVLKTGLKTRIGGFLVQPINVDHSVECYAYIIQHKEFGKLLFVTDCSEFYFRIKDCNHIMCECNWDMNVVIDNAFEDTACSQHENHLELEQTIEVLRENFNENTKSITLLHLSKNNIMPKRTLARVKEELMFDNIHIAQKGLEIDLNYE